MNLTSVSQEVNRDSYEENGEWEIHKTEAKRKEFFFDCCPNERFANVAFTIFLKRRYTFYVMNVILPSLMTSVLLLTIFFCTPAQKVQIGVVVLLSFRIFLLNVTDSIPKTSDHIPLLGKYQHHYSTANVCTSCFHRYFNIYSDICLTRDLRWGQRDRGKSHRGQCP